MKNDHSLEDAYRPNRYVWFAAGYTESVKPFLKINRSCTFLLLIIDAHTFEGSPATRRALPVITK